MFTIICIGGSYHPRILDYIDMPSDNGTHIIAADSGYAAARALGLKPQTVVGDFDSIRTDAVDQYCEIIRHSEDKDFSDTELAVHLAMERYGSFDTIIIGGGEGRLDHAYALIRTIHDFAVNRNTHKNTGTVLWYTSYECIVFLRNNGCMIHADANTIVSAFPLFVSDSETRACHVTSSGLQWSLDAVNFSNGMYSLSNKVSHPPCSVSTEGIDLMVTVSLEGYKKVTFS